MTFLGQGDLAGARAALKEASSSVDATTLTAYFASYYELGWVLDEEQKDLLLRLPQSAFDDDPATRAICFAQAYWIMRDSANARLQAELARKTFEEQVRQAPDDAQRRVFLGLSLAYLGRKEEAIQEGIRGAEKWPLSKDAVQGAYVQHQLARIYVLVGEPEKALDQLEPLLKVPYLLSVSWLNLDPNFEPLHQSQRFQRLVQSAPKS
jgi:tetratricopeptide (TPR) repeat protein